MYIYVGSARIQDPGNGDPGCGSCKTDKPMSHSILQDQALVFYGNSAGFNDTDWWPVLSEKERLRAEQYLLPSDKHTYVISRAILKRLLGRFTQVDEQKITIDYGRNGKPFLVGSTGLQFNIAHSGDVFVLAFTRGGEIGIDVESLEKDVNLSALQSYLFTPVEQSTFLQLEPSRRQEEFIRCWTRKEALLKATGDGLTQPMNTLDLSLLREDHFSVESYTPMSGYAGALAVKSNVSDIQYIPLAPGCQPLKPVE